MFNRFPGKGGVNVSKEYVNFKMAGYMLSIFQKGGEEYTASQNINRNRAQNEIPGPVLLLQHRFIDGAAVMDFVRILKVDGRIYIIEKAV
jgi:hypothetical protein